MDNVKWSSQPAPQHLEIEPSVKEKLCRPTSVSGREEYPLHFNPFHAIRCRRSAAPVPRQQSDPAAHTDQRQCSLPHPLVSIIGVFHYHQYRLCIHIYLSPSPPSPKT